MTEGMPKPPSERLQPDVEAALWTELHIAEDARDALTNAWLALPENTWRGLKPVVEGWIANGRTDAIRLRRVIDEVQYERDQRGYEQNVRAALEGATQADRDTAHQMFNDMFGRIEEIYDVLNSMLHASSDAELAALDELTSNAVGGRRWPQGEFLSAVVEDQVGLRALSLRPKIESAPLTEAEMPF